MRHLIATIILGVLTAIPASAQDAREGEGLYLRYCATCHGQGGTGHGPMRPVLTVQPADLTRLTVNNGGEFPLIHVIKRIDGRDPLVSHGSAMPVYGTFFEDEDASIKTDAGQPILTSQPVVDLVAYLRSIQVD